MIDIPRQTVQPQIRQLPSILDGLSHYPVKAHEYEQAVGSMFGLCSLPYVLGSRYPGIEAIPVPKLVCIQHLLTLFIAVVCEILRGEFVCHHSRAAWRNPTDCEWVEDAMGCSSGSHRSATSLSWEVRSCGCCCYGRTGGNGFFVRAQGWLAEPKDGSRDSKTNSEAKEQCDRDPYIGPGFGGPLLIGRSPFWVMLVLDGVVSIYLRRAHLL